jgi:UvrD-like helicase C-terminal domain/UvrD/REP helicase N-terminal domain
MKTQQQKWEELVASNNFLREKVESGIVFSNYQIPIILAMSEMNESLYIPACAGSGKSFTLTIGAYVIPERLRKVFIAFNAHIVKELVTKLPKNCLCKTCHALALECLGKATGKRIKVHGGGWNGPPPKYREKCKEIVERRFPNAKYIEKKEALSFISDVLDFTRNTLTNFNSIDELETMVFRYSLDYKPEYRDMLGDMPEIINWGIQLFENAYIVDFTDMLWLIYALNIEVPNYGAILVDEAQDLNALQHEFIARLASAGGKVVIVGDPYQSMYAFTGATIGSMEVLKDKFNAIELPLSICYRCPSKHIELARLADGDRTEARPNAPEGKIEFIEMENLYKLVQPKDLIMCRLTAPLISACIKLIYHGVPATVLGRNISKQLTSLVEEAMKPGDDLIPPDWKDFVPLMESHAAIVRDKLARSADGDMKIELYNDRVDAVMACYNSPNFNSSSKEAFISAIEKLFSDKESIVTLCTVHRAKGLEANRVFLIADKADRDCMPFKWKNQKDSDLEQEYNIIYVALTRSKDELYFVSSSKKASQRHTEHFRRRWRQRKQIQPPVENSIIENATIQQPEEKQSQQSSPVKVKKGKGKIKRIAFVD